MVKTDTIQWFPAMTLDDLWEGEMDDVEIEGHTVLLAHLDGGDIVAYQGLCPHQEMYLADGDLENGVLTCHAHHWQFAINDGGGVNPKNCQLYQYEVKVEGEQIYIGFPKGDTNRYKRCTAD